jgi:hypothetical protein
VMVGSVCRPKLQSLAGHCAEVSEHVGVRREREVGDDSWGRLVSEREREQARAERATLLGRGCVAGPSAGAGERERAGTRERAARLGWTGRREGVGPVRFSILFFFFKILNSDTI